MTCKPCGSGLPANVVGEINSQPLGQSLTPIVSSIPLPPPAAGACVQPCITPVAGQPPGCNSGGCGQVAQIPCPTGVPFYQGVSLCPNDNTKQIVSYVYTATVQSSTAFNMPSCGGTAQVVFPGLKTVALYSQFWAYGVGYLTVTAFDPGTGTVTLRNDCPSGCGAQLAPGSLIGSCTPFVVTAPPCSSQTQGLAQTFPYLAAQFTAPMVGNCIDIAVTTTNGLSVNKIVQIAGGNYLLDTIYSSTLVKICNQGQGVTPGTVVNAQDSAGNYITPIVLVDSNVCNNAVVFSGKLMVCKNNNLQPLAGLGNNQVPVLDISTGEVNFRDLLIPVGECTSLTVCLTVDPANPVGYQYLIQVADSSIFLPGDVIVIQGTLFTVVSLPTATTIRATINVPPSAIQTYAVGVSVCGADCCTKLDIRVDAIEAELAEPHAGLGFADEIGVGVPFTVSSVQPEFTSGLASIVFVNPSATKAMVVVATIDGEYHGSFTPTDTTESVFRFVLKNWVNGVPITVANVRESFAYPGFPGAYGLIQDRRFSYTQSYLVPAGGNINLAGEAEVFYQSGTGGYTVDDPRSVTVHIAGIAVVQ